MSRKNNKKKKLMKQSKQSDYSDYSVVQDDYEQGSILEDDEKHEEQELLEQTKQSGNGYTSEMTVDVRERWEKTELTLNDKIYLILIMIMQLIIPLVFLPVLILTIYIRFLKWLDWDVEKQFKDEVNEVKKNRDILNEVKACKDMDIPY